MSHVQNNLTKIQRLAFIGEMVEDKIARNELSKAQLSSDMDAYLRDPVSRTQFGLPAIKIEKQMDDGLPSPEQNAIRRYYFATCLMAIMMIAMFMALAELFKPLPGMIMVLLLAVTFCLLMMESVVSSSMQAYVIKLLDKKMSSEKLLGAQLRLSARLAFLSLSSAVAAGITGLLLGFPSLDIVQSYPLPYSTAMSLTLLALFAHVIVLLVSRTWLFPTFKVDDADE